MSFLIQLARLLVEQGSYFKRYSSNNALKSNLFLYSNYFRIYFSIIYLLFLCCSKNIARPIKMSAIPIPCCKEMTSSKMK